MSVSVRKFLCFSNVVRMCLCFKLLQTTSGIWSYIMSHTPTMLILRGRYITALNQNQVQKTLLII